DRVRVRRRFRERREVRQAREQPRRPALCGRRGRRGRRGARRRVPRGRRAQRARAHLPGPGGDPSVGRRRGHRRPADRPRRHPQERRHHTAAAVRAPRGERRRLPRHLRVHRAGRPHRAARPGVRLMAAAGSRPVPSGGGRGNRLALATLGLGAFVIGTAELVSVGVLTLIADDLGISEGTAGLLVTAYALGIALGGPLLTAATMRLPRRTLLWLTLAVFVAGNVGAVAGTVFGLVFVARLLCGALHGLFVGAATTVATGLVAPEHRGQAVGLVFGGISVATVLGVPVGTVLGQNLGWQATFLGV